MLSTLRPFRALLCTCAVLFARTAAAQPMEPPPPAPLPARAAEATLPPAPQATPVVEAPAAPQATPVAEPPPAALPPAPAAYPASSDGPSSQSNIHGLGFSGGFTTGSGFSYRRYFGDTAAQLNGIAIVSDYGNDALVFGGLSVIQYLMIWHQANSRGLLPSVTALRLVGGATYFYSRQTNFDSVPDPSCGINDFCTWISEETVSTDRLFGLGAGIGFEFGAIMHPGFSVNLDLMLTAAFDEAGLSFILPLPTAGLMYSW